MPRSRFLWKLYASYVSLITILTVIVGVLVTNRVESDMLDEIAVSLTARAALLRDAAMPSLLAGADSPAVPHEAASTASLEQRVRSLGAETATRLTIIRKDGVVIADSEEDPSRMDNHANRPEIVAAGGHEAGRTVRFSNTVGTKMMYVALAARHADQVVGFVRTSLPLAAVDDRLGRIRNIIIATAVAAAILALLLGFLMARDFATPLSSMTAVADAMSRGDYGQELSEARRDEVGQLAEAFNRMARSGQERMETITTEHNKLLAILGGMVEGVVAIDADERVTHMNACAARLLRAAPDAAIGKKIWEVSRSPEVCEALATTASEGHESRRQLRLVNVPRDQVVEMTASPLRDGDGALVGAVIVLHDLTEMSRLETMRSDFVANVSHELKTPITAIRGLVETMLDDREMPDETRYRFLGRVLDQSMRLATLVTDLLALSRLESEEALLEKRPVDLRETYQAAVQSLLPTAAERGVTMSAELPDSPLEVNGDAEALREVGENLLDNAIKYTPPGGQVWFRLRSQDGNAALEVQDTGIGIERSQQARIFERFYRVDKARSRELGGTGLGLAIVKHVVLAHHGQVSVESTPGRGSTFRVSLPIASSQAPTSIEVSEQ